MNEPVNPRSLIAPFQHLRRCRISTLLALLVCLCGLYLVAWPPAPLTPDQGRSAGIALIAIGLWATAALPEHLTALLFFLGTMLMDIAPTNVVFSGFTSAALWMVFAGMVIAVAVKLTGLGERLARSIALRLGGSYPRLIGGMLLIGMLLAFVMPSSVGRVVLLIPITLAMADYFGFEPGSNGRTGLVLAAAFGTFQPAFSILPANVPNMVLIGSSETLYHIAPLYGEYLLLHFPVLGLLKSLLILGLILRRYPDQPKPMTRETDGTRLSWQEWRLAGILALALVFWLTDFLHHISPAWIGLAAAVVLMMPRFGLINPQSFNSHINFSPLFFIAGVLGLGALISYSGLGIRLANALTAVLPLTPGDNGINFASLAFIAIATGITTTLPGIPAVLTPLADQLAQASGLPIKTVLMTQVLGFSTSFFVYQAPPLVIAMQLAGENTRPVIRMTLLLAIISVLVLIPLDYLWWRWLGWL